MTEARKRRTSFEWVAIVIRSFPPTVAERKGKRQESSTFCPFQQHLADTLNSSLPVSRWITLFNRGSTTSSGMKRETAGFFHALSVPTVCSIYIELLSPTFEMDDIAQPWCDHGSGRSLPGIVVLSPFPRNSISRERFGLPVVFTQNTCMRRAGMHPQSPRSQ